MSFRIVKFIIGLSSLIFGLLFFKTIPLIEFNNDHWLPESNQYQQDLDYHWFYLMSKRVSAWIWKLNCIKIPKHLFY